MANHLHADAIKSIDVLFVVVMFECEKSCLTIDHCVVLAIVRVQRIVRSLLNATARRSIVARTHSRFTILLRQLYVQLLYVPKRLALQVYQLFHLCRK